MLKHYLLGREAEEQALNWYLAQKESVLIAKNYRCKGGEIDLIFEEQNSLELELVFVEVKARSKESWFEGPESVDWVKQRRLKRAARHFSMRYRGKATRMRFDLLYWEENQWKHMPNLWISDEV